MHHSENSGIESAQKEIDELIQMFKMQKDNHKSVPLNIFNEPLFKKHYKDEKFLSQYIQMIEVDGIYTKTPYFKRAQYQRVHEKFYSKKENRKLYKVLKPYFYMYIPLIIEEILLISLYYFATQLCFNTQLFLKQGDILLFMIIGYPFMMRKQNLNIFNERVITKKLFVWGYA